MDTGARRAEVAGLKYTLEDEATSDVGLDERTLRVVGKGNRPRYVKIGHKTVNDLDRYPRG